MANRVFIVPRRNDLNGMNVQITDLWPNTSQKNDVLDGEGQTHYVGSCVDTAGATVVNGTSYVSGSRNTTLASNPAAADTTGGGNDCTALSSTVMGLAAYLRERVAKDPGGANLVMPFANANTVAGEILTRVEAGGAIDATYINSRLAAAAGGATSLTGGLSFGTVLDILRICSGETYLSPQYTVITDGVNFIGTAARQILVGAQVTGVTGLTFAVQGHFLTASEVGFSGRPTLTKTGILLASAGAGQLHHFAQSTMVVTNPLFTYGSGTAKTIAGVAIAAGGAHSILAVYDHIGVKIV